MAINTYQKRTNNGKPVIDGRGLPKFSTSVEKRIKTVRDMLTIGMNDNDAKWFNIQSSMKLIRT
jgi:hypothetical protein